MRHDYVIKSEGILLRPINEEDLITVVNWRNKDSIRKWFINNDQITIERQIKWFEKYIETPNDYIFVIEESNVLKQAVGIASLYNVDKEQAEFGRLFIGQEEARGKNIGKKVVKLLCEFAFDELEIKKIYLDVLNNNEVAINIYQKMWFSNIL